MGQFTIDTSRISSSEKVGKGVLTKNFDIILYMQSSILQGKRYIVKVITGDIVRFKSKSLKNKKDAQVVFDNKRSQVFDVLEGKKTLSDLKK